MPSSTPDPWTTTDPADQSSRLANYPQDTRGAAANPDETQLELQFFAIVDGYRGEPPERVYWRDAVEFIVRKTLREAAYLTVGDSRSRPRRVSASRMILVGLALYYFANRAGIICLPQRELAPRLGLDQAELARTLTALKSIGLLRTIKLSRRTPERLAMNIGGLSWTTARRQARERRRLARARNLTLDLQPRTPSDGLSPSLGGLSDGLSPSPLGVRTGGSSTSTAAAEVRRIASATANGQQQQHEQHNEASPRQRRIDGLLAACAARARAVGQLFDEVDERRRLAEGEIDVEALQVLADHLEQTRLDREHRRRYGR